MEQQKDEIDDLDQRVDQNEKNVVVLDGRTKRQQKDLRKARKDIDKNAERIDDVDERLDDVEEDIVDLDSRVLFQCVQKL